MRAVLVVVVLPSLQLLARIVQRDELVDVEKLVAQPPVEGLDQAIIRGLSGAGVVEFDPSAIRPLIQRLGGEFRPVVHGCWRRPETEPDLQVVPK